MSTRCILWKSKKWKFKKKPYIFSGSFCLYHVHYELNGTKKWNLKKTLIYKYVSLCIFDSFWGLVFWFLCMHNLCTWNLPPKNQILDVEARERYIYKSLSHRIMRQPFIILLLWLLIPPLASSNYSTVHCANDRDIGINRRQCLWATAHNPESMLLT